MPFSIDSELLCFYFVIKGITCYYISQQFSYKEKRFIGTVSVNVYAD